MYSKGFSPLSFAVSMTEKATALAFTPGTEVLNSQFFLLCSREHKRNYVLSKFMCSP